MAAERLLTAAELEVMPGAEDYELVRGHLVPVTPAGDRHGVAAVILGAALHRFVRERRLGRVRVETGFVLSRNPDTVRGPDVSFVGAGKPAGDTTSAGFVGGAPDLAVEIISPSNSSMDVSQKVREYLAAGTRLVWVLDTDRRVLHVHRPAQMPRMIAEDEDIDGEDVVAGFRYPLHALLAELD